MAWPDSDYPGGIDAPPDPPATLDGTPLHDELHLFAHSAAVKIEQTLGTNPQGSFSSVADRLDGAAVSFAPATVTGLTKGDGTEAARYARIGPLMFVYWKFTLGSTSAVTGDLTLSLPVVSVIQRLSGTCYFDDATGTRYHGQVEQLAGNTTVVLRPSLTSATYATTVSASATVPMTWAVGDIVVANFWYFADL